MAVIGHALVGLATAACAEPRARRLLRTALWTPMLVGLAYLPDIISQPATLLGFQFVRDATHSFLFAVGISAPIAFGLARLFQITYRRAFVVALASLLLHIAMDLSQATNHRPWWPFSIRATGPDVNLIPTGLHWEALIFGGVFVLVLCFRTVVWRRRPERLPEASRDTPGGRRAAWVSAGLTIGILVIATTVHLLRDEQSRELHTIRDSLAAGEFDTVLLQISRAKRWLPEAKPGRLDYYAAEASLGLADRPRAEEYYLRAYRANPGYFWLVVDLAVFRASSDEPASVRRERTEPLLRRLREEFKYHKDQPRFLEKIERKLAQPPP